jgi:DNA-binding CsgD family transcriptional regulator
MLSRAHKSIESCGKAGFTVDATGRITWQTPRAREWLAEYVHDGGMPAGLKTWLSGMGSEQGAPHSDNGAPLSLTREAGRLKFHYAGMIEGGERLLLLEEHSEDLSTRRLAGRLGLTTREAEVLNWLSAGKTNRDIAEILGISPRTVNKHLERIYVKLGVETRSAAAAVAVQTMSSPAVA